MKRRYSAKRRIFKKRRYNRRKRASRSVQRIYKSPVADSTIVKLRYVGARGLNPTVGGVADNWTIKANGMFDPDLTGVGHQFLGFDQWMAFYNHFQVMGSKITAVFQTQLSTSTLASAWIAIGLDDDNTAISDMLAYFEQPGVTAKPLTSVYAKGYERITKKFSSKRFFFGKGTDTVLRGTASADPSEIAYYRVLYGTPVNDVDLPECQVIVYVSYYARLYERKTLPTS